MSVFKEKVKSKPETSGNVKVGELNQRFSHGDSVEVIYESTRSGKILSSSGEVYVAERKRGHEFVIYSPKHESVHNRRGCVKINKHGYIKNERSHTPHFGRVIGVTADD